MLHDVSAATGLPLPGAGRTAERWRRLAQAARQDVTAGRMLEAHADAAAILAELGGAAPAQGNRWGVWAADPPSGRLIARRESRQWYLDGTKEWCSGAGTCTHALVTAHAEDGYRLFEVDLTARRADATACPVPGTWPALGMAGSDTRSVAFAGAPVSAIGEPGAYLDRPGFWHGAIGVAAAWYGGARGVADRLRVAHRERPLSVHALAHAGAVESDLAAARALLVTAASDVDGDPQDRAGQGMARALAVLATVEGAATRTVDHVGRALGPGPLTRDAEHARRVADLTVYLRQSHAERDLEVLATALLDAGEVAW